MVDLEWRPQHSCGTVCPFPQGISAALLYADRKIAVISTICWDESESGKVKEEDEEKEKTLAQGLGVLRRIWNFPSGDTRLMLCVCGRGHRRPLGEIEGRSPGLSDLMPPFPFNQSHTNPQSGQITSRGRSWHYCVVNIPD